MYRLRFLFVFSFLFVLISCETKDTQKPKEVGQEVKKTDNFTFTFDTELEFTTVSGKKKLIHVATAIKPEERNAGLMGVEQLDWNHGMLFVFEKNQPLSFWMANTPLSLDIIFVDDTYKIVRIHNATAPFATQSYASGKDAKFVIEVNGGFCVENDIIEGSEVGFAL